MISTFNFVVLGLIVFMSFDLSSQSLSIDKPFEAKMNLLKTREVNRQNKKPKSESLGLEIALSINPTDIDNYIFTWKVIEVSEKYKGLSREEKSDYKKYLKGAELSYKVDGFGKITKFTNLSSSSRKIKLDTEAFLESYQNENLDTEQSDSEAKTMEEWLSDTFEGLYYIELLSFVTKYHASLSGVIPEDNPSYKKGEFEKTIAKENLASNVEINYKKLDTTLVYEQKERLDLEGCLHIFEKDEAAFRPFKKDYILDLLKSDQILPKTDLVATYNIEDGLVYHLSEAKYYRFTKTEYYNNFDIRLVSKI